MTDATARFALPHILPGQAQKEVFHNEALALVDTALHPVAESRGDNVPAASPSIGECWIVGGAPTGAWAGQADKLAVWTNGGWRFLQIPEAMHIWLRADEIFTRRTDSGWIDGEVTAGTVIIDGEQIVGAREAAIANVSGGSIIDTEARGAINAILAALRNHGLIES